MKKKERRKSRKQSKNTFKATIGNILQKCIDVGIQSYFADPGSSMKFTIYTFLN